MTSTLSHDSAYDADSDALPGLTTPEAILCFSHLRWDFVYQRPQHLLSRFSTSVPVFYFEEAIHDTEDCDYFEETARGGVTLVVPHLCNGRTADEDRQLTQTLLAEWLKSKSFASYICWYYTPMALHYTRFLQPNLTVYDCMDELAAFRFAPPELLSLEQELLRKADIVFTGGDSLYEAKKDRHHSVHCFPSSIDKGHFAAARAITADPEDVAAIPHPRFGFFGVLDERFDSELLRDVAALRPDWHFVMIGPVVKIDPESLPKAANIHYRGGKSYDVLPSYLAGWDVATILFALNESTRYISPTKTPEYLAAGKPVISTAIRDVARPYGDQELVEIVLNAGEFLRAGERILAQSATERDAWLHRSDYFLADKSWDNTVEQMQSLIGQMLKARQELLSQQISVFA